MDGDALTLRENGRRRSGGSGTMSFEIMSLSVFVKELICRPGAHMALTNGFQPAANAGDAM